MGMGNSNGNVNDNFNIPVCVCFAFASLDTQRPTAISGNTPAILWQYIAHWRN